jgi:hypothetical protein
MFRVRTLRVVLIWLFCLILIAFVFGLWVVHKTNMDRDGAARGIDEMLRAAKAAHTVDAGPHRRNEIGPGDFDPPYNKKRCECIPGDPLCSCP